jgi:hypothetical protein
MFPAERRARPHRATMYHVVLSGALACSTIVACGNKQSPARGPAQPLEERRALQVIAGAIHGEGLQPIPGRTVEVGASRQLEMDVGVSGHKFGVAYTFESERAALGAALAPREFESQLQLVMGTGEDRHTQVLVLHASDYMLDDHLGTDYEASTITAERKLERDVRDFVVEAREKRWP